MRNSPLIMSCFLMTLPQAANALDDLRAQDELVTTRPETNHPINSVLQGAFSNLPIELEHYIFSFLAIRDWRNLSLVSKDANASVRDNKLWANLLTSMGVQIESTHTSAIDYFKQLKAFTENEFNKINFDKIIDSQPTIQCVKNAACFGFKRALRMRCKDSTVGIKPQDEAEGLRELRFYARLYNYAPAFEALTVAYRTTHYKHLKSLSLNERNQKGIAVLKWYERSNQEEALPYIMDAYNYNYFNLKMSDPEYKEYSRKSQLKNKSKKKNHEADSPFVMSLGQ